MNSKYFNVMLALITGLLAVIACCLLFQVAVSIWPLHVGRAVPVLVQGFDIGEQRVPVSIKDSYELDVSITAIDIGPTRIGRRHNHKDTLPVSIDAVNQRPIGVINRGVPVEIK